MNHLKASLALAVALVALGTAQVSAELVHFEADDYNAGNTIQTINPSSGSTLPSARVYGVTGGNATVTFAEPLCIGVYDVDGVGKVLGAPVTQSQGFIDRWQGSYLNDPPSYALKARFASDLTTPTTVTYVEVDFCYTNSADLGKIQGYVAGSGLIETTVPLSEGEQRGTAVLYAPDGASFSYITATAGVSNMNVYITGLRYGTGPEVPEPGTIVSLLLGCVGLTLWRKRLA